MLAEKLNSLLDQFKTKYPSLVGIDISSSAVRLGCVKVGVNPSNFSQSCSYTSGFICFHNGVPG